MWAEVSAAQGQLADNLGASVKSRTSESSYQLTLEAPKVQQTAAGFKKDLAKLVDQHPDALGFVLVVNGHVTGADVYTTHDLFRRSWPKLLESAAVEAITTGKPTGTTIEPSMADVRAAATGYGAQITEERQINRRTRSVRAELPQGIVFETTDTAAPTGPVHRSFIAK